MKMNSLKAAAAIGLTALFAGNAAAQGGSSTASKPVGYETININQDFNYVGLRLIGSEVGSTTVAGVSGSTVSLADAPSVNGDVILEVASGAASGVAVVATVSGNSVTLPADLAADLAVADQISMRQTQTLESVFGAVPDPSVLDGAVSSGAADLVLIPDGADGFDTFFYSTGGFGGNGAGWQQVAADGSTSAVDPGDIVILYTEGFIIQNRGSDNSLVVTGSVKTTPSSQALTGDFNYLATVYPAGATLATAFNDPQNPGVLRNGTIDGAASVGAADLVLVPNPSGGFETYFYFTGGFGGAGAGWQQVGNGGATSPIDPSSVQLGDASSIIIQNRGDSQQISVNPPAFYSNL